MVVEVRRIVIAALAAVLAAAVPAAAQEAGGVGAVQGEVMEAGGGPVAGAPVRVFQGRRVVRTATTDAAGRYRVADLPAGAYAVRVEAVGYHALERQARVEAGSELRLSLALRPAPVELAALDVVSATRSGTPVAAIPGAVSVVGREEIERGAAVSQGVGEILGKAVPGLAAGTQSMSNYGQTLRGRSVVVLIDGVPQSTLRNVSRDFATIDPAMIERVEVLRGATAIYGDGATGGVINIVTRRPGVGAVSLRTEVGTTASLSSPLEGLGARVVQSVSGSGGVFDYVASGSYQTTGSSYDAEGDRIPADPHGQGGLADTRSYDLFGKLGLTRGRQRLQLSANYLHSDQDTEFTADPAVDTLPAGAAKARAIGGLREYEPQGTRNLNLSLDYTHGELLGSRVHAQGYFRDYLTRFRGFDRRVFRNGAWTSGHVGQSFVDSEKWGGRLELETPLRVARGSLLWGADYTYENTAQLMTIMDPAVYDASGGVVFDKIGERYWVPPLKPHNLGLFAQLGWNVTDRLLVRGGARYERVRMHVDDFVTIDDARVEGGDVAYDPVLFNVGAVFDATAAVNVFANFAQGFSLADVGRILRGARDGFVVGASTLEAPKVDHYEVGARGAWSAGEASVSVFYSTSELGTRLVPDEDGVLRVARAPERIYGAEATLDLRRGAWGWGGSASWTEGEYEGTDPTTQAVTWRPFDGYRIQPLKVTAYVEHTTAGGWTNRLSALRSGSRDRVYDELGRPPLASFQGAQYGGAWPVEGYTVVDFRSRRPLGPGHLEVGVQNLLNNQYFDVLSQLNLTDGNSYYTAARGRMLNVGYSVAY